MLVHLGFKSRSGLWQRKTGYHGRKIRAVKQPTPYKEPKPLPDIVLLNSVSEEHKRNVIQVDVKTILALLSPELKKNLTIF